MKSILSTLGFFLLATYSIYGQATIGDPPPPPSLPDVSPITGTWIQTEDANSKWIFTENPDLVRQYYDGELTGEYNYTLHTSPPASYKCGNTLLQNPNPDLEYLVLEDISSNNYYCYIIYGLNENYLTINPIRTGRIIKFSKD